MQTATQALFVAIGSMLGGLLRWGTSVWFAKSFGNAFPFGTLFINLSGSLFLGWFTAYAEQRFLEGGWLAHHQKNVMLMVAVGFTGAYTTFSTFELETNKLLSNGAGLAATTYVAMSVVLGLYAVRLGVWLAR